MFLGEEREPTPVSDLKCNMTETLLQLDSWGMSWGFQACHGDDIPQLRGPGLLNLLPANPWSVTYMSSKVIFWPTLQEKDKMSWSANRKWQEEIKWMGREGKVSDWKGIILPSNANPANYRAELINGLLEHFQPVLHIVLIFLQIHITQLTCSFLNNHTWRSFQSGGENIALLQKKRI